MENRITDLDKPLVILHDFTGVYEQESFYRDYEYKMISEKEIEGTRGYLDEEAGRKLAEQIRMKSSLPAFHFLDSGNYHYMSKLYAGGISEPYILIVFDNHTDMQPSAFGRILSCGSWIADLYEDGREGKAIAPEKIIIVGAKNEYILECMYKDDPNVFFCDTLIESGVKAVLDKVSCEKKEELPVYISIDKDVLSKEEFDSDWDQGQMNLSKLISELEFIRKDYSIIGVDVCGEPELIGTSIEKSDAINRAIIDCITGLRSLKQ